MIFKILFPAISLRREKEGLPALHYFFLGLEEEIIISCADVTSKVVCRVAILGDGKDSHSMTGLFAFFKSNV